MKFMVQGSSAGDTFEAWTGWAWVTLNDNAVKELIEKMELFQMVKSRNRAYADVVHLYGISQLEFHGSPCFWFQDGEWDLGSFLTEAEKKEFERWGVLRLPDERELPHESPPEGEPYDVPIAPVDCERTIVDDRGIGFSCYLADYRVYSGYITWDALLGKK